MRRFQFLCSSKDDGITVAAPADASGVPMGSKSLKYDPHLILQLKQEHASLLKLFDEIGRAHAAHDYAALQGTLREFNICLNMHLLEENVKFYAYLRNALARDADNLATMTAYWKEMQELGRVVIQFLKKYELHRFGADGSGTFQGELATVGSALASRLRREEETLFALYAPGD